MPAVQAISPVAALAVRRELGPADQEDVLIDAITARATESLKHDLAGTGLSDDFDLEISPARTARTGGGEKNVSHRDRTGSPEGFVGAEDTRGRVVLGLTR
ncbi:hypothetical protein GCM10022223_41230 [Kineosporia mesophila]|uniref:Uncharacterized protein n=1 Tax=Kineosporia mesophila TaxID=566012 RepID=A0ABP6ZXK3_9ACTN|nr:hypothetical protein [Kineosporia mesophila]MCD5348738.1 hypothetical protein [Kineosporia mesophila]